MLDDKDKENALEEEEELPWLLFRVCDNVYTINSKAVNGIMIMPEEITRVPDSPELFRGIANIRGDVYPVLDLRRLFKQKSAQEETEEFCEIMNRRKADHEKWIKELDRCLHDNDKFTLATDPHECAFGKWYYGFQSKSSMLNFHLRKIEEPHRLLHETAEKALQCRGEGNEEKCAEKLIKTAREEYIPEVLRLIEESKGLYAKRYQEMMVVITDGENQMGLVVDEVLTVEPLSEICPKNRIQAFYRQDYIIGVARSKRVEGDILMLDEMRLLERRKEYDE